MVKLWSSKPSLWVRFPFPLFDPIMVFFNFFFNFFTSVFYQNKIILNVFFVFIGWFLNLVCVYKNNIFLKNNLVKFETEKGLFLFNIYFYILDILHMYYTQFKCYKYNSKLVFFKTNSLNNNKFYVFNNIFVNNSQIFLYGLRSV